MHTFQEFGVLQHREQGVAAITRRMQTASFLEHLLSSGKPAVAIRQTLGLCTSNHKTIDARITSALSRLWHDKLDLCTAMEDVTAASLDLPNADIIVDLDNGRNRVTMVHNRQRQPENHRTQCGRDEFYPIIAGRQ